MGRGTLFLAACVVFLLAACGGGGGGGGISLQGTWYGTGEAAGGTEHLYRLTFDGEGNVTGFSVDGGDTGLTGTATRIEEGFFEVSLDGGSVTGGIMVDPGGKHMVYFDDGEVFAVLEKGADAMPEFSVLSVCGSWSGSSVACTNAPGVWGTAPYSSMSVNSPGGGDLPLTLYGGTTNLDGVFLDDTGSGRYSGSLAFSMGNIADLVCRMTADYRALGCFAGRVGISAWPEEFVFLLMDK